jgi:hypothetical protein
MKRIILSPLYWRCLMRTGVVKTYYKTYCPPSLEEGANVLVCSRGGRSDRIGDQMCVGNIVHCQKVNPTNDEDLYYQLTLSVVLDVVDL